MLRGSMNLGVIVSARLYTLVSFTYSFEVIPSFLCFVIHLSSFVFISIYLSNYSLYFVVLSSITKKGGDCTYLGPKGMFR
jgi:hypothetical protein